MFFCYTINLCRLRFVVFVSSRKKVVFVQNPACWIRTDRGPPVNFWTVIAELPTGAKPNRNGLQITVPNIGTLQDFLTKTAFTPFLLVTPTIMSYTNCFSVSECDVSGDFQFRTTCGIIMYFYKNLVRCCGSPFKNVRAFRIVQASAVFTDVIQEPFQNTESFGFRLHESYINANVKNGDSQTWCLLTVINYIRQRCWWKFFNFLFLFNTITKLSVSMWMAANGSSPLFNKDRLGSANESYFWRTHNFLMLH